MIFCGIRNEKKFIKSDFAPKQGKNIDLCIIQLIAKYHSVNTKDYSILLVNSITSFLKFILY